MLFHSLQGNPQLLGHFLLGQLVNLVHDEYLLTTRRQLGNRIAQTLQFMSGLVTAIRAGKRASQFGQYRLLVHPRLAPPLAAVMAGGAIMGDLAQQRQGHAHTVLLWRLQ